MKNHIKLEKGQCPERVIVCGDPDRALRISKLLSNSALVSQNREYHSYLGKCESKEILVISHGIGSAGAAICFNELIDSGAKIIIRVGSAGALRDDLDIGSIVVPTAAIRRDGVSHQMVPTEYPAVPDHKLTYQLLESLSNNNCSATEGVILTSDLFYPSLLATEWEFYKKANAVAVEMECATLFIICQLRGVKSASVLTIDGNPLKWNEGKYDPDSQVFKKSLQDAAHCAIKTLVGKEK
jgi:uridine phosphorylase